MHTFKNLSKDTPRGINTVDLGTVYIAPGQTSGGLNVADGELEFLKSGDLFEIKSAKKGDAEAEPPKTVEDGSEQNSTAHREGNVPQPGGAGATSPAAVPDDEIDAMTDEQLRAFITDRDGRAPHPNTGREKLLAKAKDANAKEEEAV